MRARTIEELCALVRRGAGGRWAPRPAANKNVAREPSREPPALDVRDVRCGNCGAKGQTSQICPEERRGPQARTFFNCREAAYVAAKRPKAPGTGSRARLVRTLDEVNGTPKILDCKMLDTDGYVPSHRLRRHGVERLRRKHLLEEIPELSNRFAALEMNDEQHGRIEAAAEKVAPFLITQRKEEPPRSSFPERFPARVRFHEVSVSSRASLPGEGSCASGMCRHNSTIF